MPGGNIFLNYRRDDTAGHAGRLFDRLNWRFPGRVFRDVTGIDLGLDFVQEVERKLADCQVLIVLIGKHWLTLTDGKGRRRIDSERDLVRLEVAAGLRRNIRVIPVLVLGAQMPSAEDLPPDLRPLTNRNALEITEPDFENDVARLIRALEQALGEQPLRPDPPPRPAAWKKLLLAAVLLGGFAVAALAFFIMLRPEPDPRPAPLNNSPASPQPQPSAWPGARQTPTAKSKSTPTPEPSPDDSPQSKGAAGDFLFQPVGRWLLRSDRVPFSMVLVLAANNSFLAEGQDVDGPFRVRGQWAYLGGERALLIDGQDEDGEPVARRVEILGPHEDHYDVVLPGVGQLKMWRR